MGKRSETIYHAIDFLDSQLLQSPKDPFDLAADFVPINLSTTVPVAVTVPDEADFLWVLTTGSFFGTDNTTVIASPAFLISYRDSGSGRNLESAPVHVACRVGTAQNPFVWPYPKLLKRATTLTITLQNLSGATNANVHLCLSGFKIFSR